MAKRVLVPWFGGKNRLAPKLVQLIPADHVVYCEPFGGAASVLLTKERSKIEVYNDLNEGLYSLFRVVSDEQYFAKFYGQLVLHRYSRQAFDRNLERWRCSSDIIERALAFYILARQSFGGKCETFGYERGATGNKVPSYLHALDSLPDIHERTTGVIVEHHDWRLVLGAYDTPQTVFYVDPPYVPESRRSANDYTHELTPSDHIDLVHRLLALQGRAILSGYPNLIYKPLEDAGWKRLEWQVTSSACGTTRTSHTSLEAKQRTECVWLDPRITISDDLVDKVGARLGAPMTAPERIGPAVLRASEPPVDQTTD